jgi:hypothetical protein
VAAEALESWLVGLYAAAIRAADESKRFERFEGSLRLEPAGFDADMCDALLRGEVRLDKENEAQSSAEGKVEAVLSYRQNVCAPRSLRALVRGTYLDRVGGTS